ncbi:MAG: hypothetical protein HRT38_17545 [Alteromonadaceae bacterium]|nr:hypothetical protein [Alteromonadaceae bacterium]
MSNFYCLHILDRLRKSKSKSLAISDILPPEDGGKIPYNTGTGGGIFGSSLIALMEIELIKVSTKQGNDCTNEMLFDQSISNNTALRDGYALAKFLAGKETTTYLSLTVKLEKFQRATGYSLTRQIEYELTTKRDDTILARPVFGKPSGQPKSDVFVLMPFNDVLDQIYNNHIKFVCEKNNLICTRADEQLGTNAVMNDIWEQIHNSELIVADCTGRNPNVFYELGIAHTLGKKVLIITGNSEDIPFDIRHLRYIPYAYTVEGMREFDVKLSENLDRAFNKKMENHNFNRQRSNW